MLEASRCEDDIALVMDRDTLVILRDAAAARGCSIEEFVLSASLTAAREDLDLDPGRNGQGYDISEREAMRMLGLRGDSRLAPM